MQNLFITIFIMMVIAAMFIWPEDVRKPYCRLNFYPPGSISERFLCRSSQSKRRKLARRAA